MKRPNLSFELVASAQPQQLLEIEAEVCYGIEAYLDLNVTSSAIALEVQGQRATCIELSKHGPVMKVSAVWPLNKWDKRLRQAAKSEPEPGTWVIAWGDHRCWFADYVYFESGHVAAYLSAGPDDTDKETFLRCELEEMTTEPPAPILADIWQAVINRIEYRSTQLLLREQSQLMAVEKGQVTIAVTQQWRSSLEARKQSIETAFAQELNRPVSVNFQAIAPR
jgi:hypothetical protein